MYGVSIYIHMKKSKDIDWIDAALSPAVLAYIFYVLVT